MTLANGMRRLLLIRDSRFSIRDFRFAPAPQQAGIFDLFRNSEKLQLLRHRRLFFFLLAVKDPHHAELLIGNGENAHMSPGRKDLQHSLHMYIRIFTAGAMPEVGAELEHGKAVLHHAFPELCIILPVFLGFGRQVEKYHDPHDPVFV